MGCTCFTPYLLQDSSPMWGVRPGLLQMRSAGSVRLHWLNGGSDRSSKHAALNGPRSSYKGVRVTVDTPPLDLTLSPGESWNVGFSCLFGFSLIYTKQIQQKVMKHMNTHIQGRAVFSYPQNPPQKKNVFFPCFFTPAKNKIVKKTKKKCFVFCVFVSCLFFLPV